MAITSLCPGGLAQSCERRPGHFPAMALREAKAVVTAAPTFSDDLAFLQLHTDLIVLSDEESQARLAIVPAWQGHVMTTTVGRRLPYRRAARSVTSTGHFTWSARRVRLIGFLERSSVCHWKR